MIEDSPLVPFSIQEYKKIGKDFGESLGKLCMGKIYYAAYNSVRINENKLMLEKLNKDKEVTTLVKRLVLLGCILLTGVVYWLIGADVKLLVNSAILAPVAWSFIFKPICKKLGIDYKEVDNTIPK